MTAKSVRLVSVPPSTSWSESPAASSTVAAVVESVPWLLVFAPEAVLMVEESKAVPESCAVPEGTLWTVTVPLDEFADQTASTESTTHFAGAVQNLP